MTINFAEIEEISQPNFKGGEKSFDVKMFSDGKCKVMMGRLKPGASIGTHTHETNLEVLYVLSGQALCKYEGEEENLKPGDVHYCPKGHSHTLINQGNEDLRFFAVVPEL